MKWRTFAIGYIFALGLLLLVQHRPGLAQGGARALPAFRAVIDLTRPAGASLGEVHKGGRALIPAALTSRTIPNPHDSLETRMESPATYSSRLWTVGQIPAERLVAPFVVIDVREKVRKQPDYQLSVQDIANWEQTYGPIPTDAIVAAETGWGERWNSPQAYWNRDLRGMKHFPGFSEEAVKFLVEARETLALGIDAGGVAGGAENAGIDNFTLSHSTYHLENLTNLELVPARGTVVMVAPEKLLQATAAPVRVLAMVQ